MAKWGKVDYKQLKEFQKKLQEIDRKREEFINAAAKELAARLLDNVIENTPVGQYPEGSGMVGGTLKRGWTAGKETDAASFAASIPIRRNGDTYTIDIVNSTPYAFYVEYGHRTRGGGGYVPGEFMLTKAVDLLSPNAPKILEKKLTKWLGEALNGK